MARKRGQKGHLAFNSLCFVLKKGLHCRRRILWLPIFQERQKMNELNTVWNYMNLLTLQYVVRNVVNLRISIAVKVYCNLNYSEKFKYPHCAPLPAAYRKTEVIDTCMSQSACAQSRCALRNYVQSAGIEQRGLLSTRCSLFQESI